MNINGSIASLFDLVSLFLNALLNALHRFVLGFTLSLCVMIKRFVGCGGRRLRVNEGGV